MTRAIALFAAAAVALGIAVGGCLWRCAAPDDPFAPCRRSAVAGGSAAIGGPFSLTDATGARLTDADVITRPTLVYFGYTFCPDFCPTGPAATPLPPTCWRNRASTSARSSSRSTRRATRPRSSATSPPRSTPTWSA